MRPSRLIRRYAFAVCLFGGTLTFAGCSDEPPRPPEQAPEVDVAAVVVHESVEWDEYTGRLAAVESVDVRSRVTGYVEKVHFKAGQLVKQGDLLFTIDPRPFVAELDRVNADVKRAEAVLELATFDLKRIQGLYETNVAPEKEYRDAVFGEQQARADLERAKSEQRRASLDVEWSRIVAPIAGRVSRELVTAGNLVHDSSGGATILTTIVSIDPIYCYFDADEQAYLKYARMSQTGERVSSRDRPNPVHLALFDETGFNHQGQVDFVDNAMDQQTGTMRARAVFPNADGFLIPGLFARVRLLGSGVKPMMFVPDTAIVADLTTRLVFVVDDKNVVHARPVVPGRMQNGLRRIRSGLDGSETIVVKGVQRIRDGMAVQPNRVSACGADWKPEVCASTQPAPLTSTLPTQPAPLTSTLPTQAAERTTP